MEVRMSISVDNIQEGSANAARAGGTARMEGGASFCGLTRHIFDFSLNTIVSINADRLAAA